MKFYRLEKTNYFKLWGGATLKAIGLALVAVMIIMLIAGYKFMIVSSGSMEPTLPVGSLVIVTPCEKEELQLGDIVTMNAGGINLTHRVVGKYNPNNSEYSIILPEDMSAYDGEAWVGLIEGKAIYDDEAYNNATHWVTKGDNSDTIDGKLDRDIVGKVYDAHAFSWVGLAVRYIRANFKMLIIMLVLLAIFISVLEWLKNKMVQDDIECYELDEDEE